MGRDHARSDLNTAGDEVVEQGFSFVAGASLLARREIGCNFSGFADLWPDLPVDPYYRGQRPIRFRRHAELSLDADIGNVTWRPNRGYFQPLEHNPVFGGMVRHFASVEPVIETRSLLSSLILLAAREVFRLSGRWIVNVHLVRTVSDPDVGTAPAPEGPHRDGYDYVAIHLVDRDNDSGGETLILDPAGNEMHVLKLDSAMDTLYMDDRRFKHDVSPISASRRPCHRDMILMSFERPGG